MPSSSTTVITVLISIILATSAFVVVTMSQHTQPIKITLEQAISILKEGNKTDRRIVYGSSPVKADLEYITIDWANYLRNTGSEHHERIYVSETPVGEVKPYWVFDFETSFGFNYGGSGRYVVDAETGEVMLSLESTGGGVVTVGPDYLMSIQPSIYLWDPSTFSSPENFTDHALKVKLGEFTPIVLKFLPQSYYNASLPVSMKIVGVSKGFSASQNATSAILRTGGSASLLLEVFTPVTYAVDSVSPPQLMSQVPHIDIEVSFIDTTTSFSFFVVPLTS